MPSGLALTAGFSDGDSIEQHRFLWPSLSLLGARHLHSRNMYLRRRVRRTHLPGCAQHLSRELLGTWTLRLQWNVCMRLPVSRTWLSAVRAHARRLPAQLLGTRSVRWQALRVR